MSHDRRHLTRRAALKHGAVAAGGLLVGGAGAATAGIGEGRVGHYHLNDHDDGTVEDASPHDNHGTLVGDVSVIHGGGQVGNAFAFDGGHVAIEDDASLGVETVTVAAWVNPTGTKAKEYIIDGRNHQYGLKEDDGSEVPRFFLFDEDNNLHRVDATSGLEEGVWTHVAATYDGAEMRIYLDGDLSATNSDPDAPIGVSAGPARLGDYIGDGYSFAGAIDEARIYDHALSDAEIRSLATMGGNGQGGNGGSNSNSQGGNGNGGSNSNGSGNGQGPP